MPDAGRPGGLAATFQHPGVAAAYRHRHSRATGYDPGFSLPRELARRGLLRLDGQHRTAPVVFRQRPEDYLEQFHSTSSLARELMRPAEAARFGAAVLAAVRGHERDGLLDLPVTTDLTWGRPSA